ncbi:MAG TPA: hypothetical protein VM659_23425 [Dongiaceae bacterium]|nr:hypothetical protein [Dongiaceae bacterium]
MRWMKCSLSAHEVADGALIQVTNNFSFLTLAGDSPTESILFYRERVDGIDFFVSPAAEPLLQDPALSQYPWTRCSRPVKEGLIMLAGRGDPEALFRPLANLVELYPAAKSICHRNTERRTA